MRRREAGRGAAPAGLVATRHSRGIGAPSGATRSPCQELADGSVGAIRLRDGPDESRARCRKTLAIGAPRGARVPQGTSHKDFALFGAPSPSGRTPRVPLFDMSRTLKTRRGKEVACATKPHP